MFTESDTFSLFCLLMYLYFLFILLPHSVLIMYVPMITFSACSVDGHNLAFLYDNT